jgi:hypothetical protein
MKLSNATFTALRGCQIQIDGFAADIETKPAMLLDGVCSITALDPQHWGKADALLTSPCGQDGAVFGCNEPRLVELAARYNAWLDDDTNAPWADTAAEPLSPLQAAMAFQQFLSTLNPA